MKRFLLSVLFVGCLCSAYAQSKSKSISLKWTPQNMFNRNFGRFPVGVEYHVKDWSVEYEHGFGMRPIGINSDAKYETTGFQSRLGVRYYDLTFKENGLYDFLGFYITRRSQEFTKIGDWYSLDYIEYRYDVSDITINDWLIHGYYGMRLRLMKSLWIEGVYGLGARRRNVIHDTQGERLAIDEHLWDEWFAPIDRNAGIRYRPSFLVNLKLVYQLFESRKTEEGK